jgi:ClpP class serine protease
VNLVPPVQAETKKSLKSALVALEKKLDSDVIAVLGPVVPGADRKVRDALEALPKHRERLVVILQTGGGLVEVAERMVTVFRHFYKRVVFLIPDVAMSAGTILAMSGSEIWMDYYSCLGPIDPQLERKAKDGSTTYVPALSYLSQYARLVRKSLEGTMSTAESPSFKPSTSLSSTPTNKRRISRWAWLRHGLPNTNFRTG